jgi:hypothetical protein
MSYAYCENDKCEYYEDGSCEYEGILKLDCNGSCTRFRYKSLEREVEKQ